ncbi:MAG: response regulator [Verrucomicrobia bacterium]|nr:response regulator [Verrucomicrobiota bacterium]
MPTVLFADDELDKIEGLIEIVKSEGYTVLTCCDASSAVRLATTRQIDCIVIDVMMDPGSDLGGDPQVAGLAAIDAILKQRPKQGIICCSVIGDQTIVKQLKRRGVLYLKKGEMTADGAFRMIEAKATGRYKTQ